LKISTLNRILLFFTALLASYQVAAGVDGMSVIPMLAYTIGFGILLVACLMLIILGYDALESPTVAIISTIIPLSLSLGLVWEYLPSIHIPYLLFTLMGLLSITISRFIFSRQLSTLILAFVHGTAGLVIFILPIVVSINRLIQPIFIFVGVGGSLIGIGGLLLYFLKTGKPIFPRSIILNVFPALMFATTLAFVVGFSAFIK